MLTVLCHDLWASCSSTGFFTTVWGNGGWGYPLMWTTSAEGLFLQIITSPILATHEAMVSAYFSSGDHEQMEEITRRCCSASFPLGRGCVCDCVYTWHTKHWEALTTFQWWCQSERHQGCYQCVPPDRLSCRDWTHLIQRRKENCDRERKVTVIFVLQYFLKCKNANKEEYIKYALAKLRYLIIITWLFTQWQDNEQDKKNKELKFAYLSTFSTIIPQIHF